MQTATVQRDVSGCCAGSAAERFPKLGKLLAYLDSLQDRADLTILSRLLRELDITRQDIEAACHFCDSGYQRNIIKESPWYELVAICWKSGQRSPIHDHQGSSCAFRVVQGTVTELQFDHTPSGLLTCSAVNQAGEGYICASHDADIHQVLNALPAGQDVVTLHIYSPPLKNYRKYTLDTPCCEGQMKPATFPARGV